VSAKPAQPVPRDLSDRDEATGIAEPVDDVALRSKREAVVEAVEVAEDAASKEQKPPTKRAKPFGVIKPGFHPGVAAGQIRPIRPGWAITLPPIKPIPFGTGP
jgi:hypothetical protein